MNSYKTVLCHLKDDQLTLTTNKNDSVLIPNKLMIAILSDNIVASKVVIVTVHKIITPHSKGYSDGDRTYDKDNIIDADIMSYKEFIKFMLPTMIMYRKCQHEFSRSFKLQIN